MTTKVTITLAQKHMPIVVEVLREDGTIQYTQTLVNLDQAASEYVHGGQTLRIREMSTAELHGKPGSLDDEPPACSGCGAMAGVCADYPKCPGGQP